MPANTPAMIQHADIFEADGIIFDLEDAVVTNEKDAARDLLSSYLKQFEQHPMEYIVRINQIDLGYLSNDLEVVKSGRIDTILLPKASVESIHQLTNALASIEKDAQLKKRLGIIALIETPQAFFELNEIARAERVNGLLLGGEDLAMQLEVERTLEGIELLYARSQVIFAAKAYDIDAIDTPFVHVRDEEGLVQDSKRAKALGMTAKACIHPNQIDVINHIFSPNPKDIERAKKIIMASKLESNQQKGAFMLDGQMIDKPIIEKALKLIAKAKAWHLDV